MSNNMLCTRCDHTFFKAYYESVITCPYCGFSLTLSEDAPIRRAKRYQVQKRCYLTANDHCYTANTVNVSDTGLFIQSRIPHPLNISDQLKIRVQNSDDISTATVVWIDKTRSGQLRAGLSIV